MPMCEARGARVKVGRGYRVRDGVCRFTSMEVNSEAMLLANSTGLPLGCLFKNEMGLPLGSFIYLQQVKEGVHIQSSISLKGGLAIAHIHYLVNS